MTDLITIEYSLRLEDVAEVRGDEPRLEFIFLTGLGGQLQVKTVDTGILAVNFPGRGAPRSIGLSNLEVHVPISPTQANRFLGFAVRAYEWDSFDASDRASALDRLVENVQLRIGPTVAASRPPTVDQIWLAVNERPSVGGDDRIGVSARLFRSLGSEVIRDGVRRTIVPEGSQANDAFLFRSGGARWRMQFDVAHQSFG
ncbi:hypothetical protein [Roseovarius sp. Pro17]|uniref:hypothetical protein n=1 Tax=Roseovarius sp. Pro17 TaxID=3108175 RepID=UPI002D782F75|nr:hypothetical protein [Roseovarius sp. Pro17]